MTHVSLITEGFEYLKTRLPLYYKTESRLRGLGGEYFEFAEPILKTILRERKGKAGYYRALDALVRLSLDYLELQAETKKTRRYRYSSYAEVQQKVYDNPEVMGEYYLDGLLLSQVFWVNHYMICRFILAFASTLDPGMRGIDMPCGCGIHSALLLSKVSVRNHVFCDFSSRAIADSIRFVNAYSSTARAQAIQLDARERLPFNDSMLDYACCGEFLEHLEDPKGLMREFRRVLKRDGRLLITTVAFTAMLDHIYMFQSAEQVRQFIADCGFKIEQELVLAVSGRNEEIHLAEKPLNCAYLLSLQ